jgi:hypothetical protein
MTTKLTPQQQKAILNWPYTNHIPVLGCDSRKKKVWIEE